MPFVVGIALISLSTGSPISIEVLSTDDEKSSHFFQQEIIDPSNLTSTFEKIADSIPVPFSNLVSPITLVCPSYLNEDEKKGLGELVNAVPKLPQSLSLRPIDSIMMASIRVLNKVAHPPQIELALEIGPDIATARLISTCVEEDIRLTTIEKQIDIRDIRSADLITQLVNPALAGLKEIPTKNDPKRKHEVNANDLSVKRVLILDFSPTPSLVSSLVQKLIKILPLVEFIVMNNNFAKLAADRSLSQYRSKIDSICMMHVCILRLGIVKADGFVSTVLKRHHTFPTRKAVMFTTSMDKQATATIKVVVGKSPKGEDNTVVAELVLNDLTPRPRGLTRIRVTFNVEQMGETQIVAEELMEGGVMTGSTASIQLRDHVGDVLTDRDVQNLLIKYENADSDEPYHDDALESEAQWAGKEVQGDLPE